MPRSRSKSDCPTNDQHPVAAPRNIEVPGSTSGSRLRSYSHSGPVPKPRRNKTDASVTNQSVPAQDLSELESKTSGTMYSVKHAGVI